jgi:AcrR family transcriptional regulator
MVGRPRTVSDEAVFGVVARLIGEHGPEGLTLARVGREAGVSAPAIAQRFGSKRALLLAFAARGAQSVARTFTDAAAGQPSPTEALQQGFAAMVAGIDSRTALANNLAFLRIDLSDPEFHQLAAEQARELRQRVQTLLEAAAAAGELQAADTAALARTVYAAYNGALLTWAIDGSGTLQAWLRDHLDAVLAPYRT